MLKYRKLFTIVLTISLILLILGVFSLIKYLISGIITSPTSNLYLFGMIVIICYVTKLMLRTCGRSRRFDDFRRRRARTVLKKV